MSHTLTEGGQIISHRLRMLRQVIKVSFSFSLILGLVFFGFCMSQMPLKFYQSLYYYLKAYIFGGVYQKVEIDREFYFQVSKIRHTINPILPIDQVFKITSPFISVLQKAAISNIITALILSGISFIGTLSFFFMRGKRSKTKQHLSGSQITSSFKTRLLLKLRGKASKNTIGTLPLVKGTETQHMMITGGTGSGKTNCLHHLLANIRSNNQKAIIVDTSGVFLERYYREGTDYILNPLDARSVLWNPWAEGTKKEDLASIAEALIPSSISENENYWRIASKAVFISLLEKFSDTKNTSEISRWIQYESLSNLCAIVQGTKAAAHLDLSSERTASSIRSVASTFLECLETLTDTSNPFSIRNWITKEDSSWLFINCLPSQRSLLKPLITTWISAAIRGLLDLPIDLNRRIWFSIDELPSLQKIKDLDVLLTEGRKYGGCGILTLQSPSQLDNLYGRDQAKVLIGNTATKIIFRERDPEIAERISKAFGEREVLEVQEGISYGAHEARDGVNLSLQNRFRPVVSPTEIIELPVNTAYIKLAECEYVTRIKLPIR